MKALDVNSFFLPSAEHVAELARSLACATSRYRDSSLYRVHRKHQTYPSWLGREPSPNWLASSTNLAWSLASRPGLVSLGASTSPNPSVFLGKSCAKSETFFSWSVFKICLMFS